jgi:glycosyltransferase involved in cell wall biosynthesis
MKRDKKAFIILIPGFPENEADTVCLPMQQSFVKSLKEICPDLHIIVLSFQYPYYKKQYNWSDIPVTSFDGRNKGGLPRLLLRQALYKTLKNYHRSFNLAGILSFWYGECAWVGKKFADKYGLRHYCWIMGQDARRENSYPNRLKLKSTELIALSDFLLDEFEKNHGTRPQHVIPPGINSRLFKNVQEQKVIDILGTGSLIPLKQFGVFVAVVAEIKKQIPGVRGIIIGEGPEKNKLKTLIADYGLEPNIILAGELPHPEVLNMMEKAKVFLHTSSYEGFSGVCLEALHAGCHVISFCSAMKNKIEQWHIAVSTEEMKDKTIEILQNPKALFNRMNAFTMDDTVNKIMNLFPE